MENPQLTSNAPCPIVSDDQRRDEACAAPLYDVDVFDVSYGQDEAIFLARIALDAPSAVVAQMRASTSDLGITTAIAYARGNAPVLPTRIAKLHAGDSYLSVSRHDGSTVFLSRPLLRSVRLELAFLEAKRATYIGASRHDCPLSSIPMLIAGCDERCLDATDPDWSWGVGLSVGFVKGVAGALNLRVSELIEAAGYDPTKRTFFPPIRWDDVARYSDVGSDFHLTTPQDLSTTRSM